MNSINSIIGDYVTKGDDVGAYGPIIYFVHRLDRDDMSRIELPFKAYGPEFKIPKSGTSMFAWGDDIVRGIYKKKPGSILFSMMDGQNFCGLVDYTRILLCLQRSTSRLNGYPSTLRELAE